MPSFQELLNQPPSINLVNRTILIINDNEKYFDDVFLLSFSDNYKISMKASWVIVHYCKKNNSFIQKHLDFILEKLKTSNNSSVKRNMIKIFAEYSDFNNIKNLGLLVDICFRFFNNPKDAIAVRAFCLDVLMKISSLEPDIITEIKQSIEFNFDNYSTGLKNKAKKVIQLINKKHTKH